MSKAHGPVVITSFAMKEEAARATPGAVDAVQVLAPKDLDEMVIAIRGGSGGGHGGFSAIRYSAYRMASKLELLRTGLCLDAVKLSAVAGVLHQHGFGAPLNATVCGMNRSLASGPATSNRSEPDALINKQKASDVLSDIFFAAGKVGGQEGTLRLYDHIFLH